MAAILADDNSRCIFLNKNDRIPIRISLKFVPVSPINHIPALVQIMACRLAGTKPLSEPMMVSLMTHIWVTRPQWVKLLHGLSLVAVGLSVGYKTWPPIGWHRHFVIGWFKYRLWLPQSQCILGSSDRWEFIPFSKPTNIPLVQSWRRAICLSWGLYTETVIASSPVCKCLVSGKRIDTGLKLENYYFFTFTFSRPEVRKLLLFYVFTFSRPEVGKLFHISMA